MIVCRECGNNHLTGKDLSNHIKKVHGLSGVDYTIKHIHAGNRPVCLSCGEATRYTAFQFKQYCLNCVSIASSEGGFKGGKAPAWNKGQTTLSDTRVAMQSKKMSGSGNHFWGKQHDDFSRTKISLSKRLGRQTLEERIIKRSNEFVCITPIEMYTSRQQQYLQFQCIVCNHVQEKTLQAFERGSLCESCHPNSSSQWQLEVEKWICDLGIEVKRADRTVIHPKEIDIYLPEFKLGIECHGLYYHSDAKKDNNPKLHAQKAHLAQHAGIRLIQIFQDEWIDRKDIIKGMILHRIQRVKKHIGARKCKVVSLDSKLQREFFNTSHLSGYTPSKFAWGLEHEGKIVACLSVRAPRQKKWLGWLEVARFAILPGCTIQGALSRLTKQALQLVASGTYRGIMTYVDKRVGWGSGYTTAGFMLVGETGPDYWYTDLSVRYDRFTFRARDGKSEIEIATERKCNKIWGAGSFIYVINSQSSSID